MNAGTSSSPKEKGKTGRLTIFTGYASGTGKTYAMILAARQESCAGRDAVVGLVDADRWPKTRELLGNFEALPCRQMHQDGKIVPEIDLDAALRRRPQLMLIDDLSHNNTNGCRHKKRYQDINELLEAGIDIYTTLDIQNVESLQDGIAEILGQNMTERIPDRVFDRADRVQMVDIEPQELHRRLQDNESHDPMAVLSLNQLNALRELALRRCADRIAMHTKSVRNQAAYRTNEHILVCLSSAPSNEKIIRTAARMAGAFQCEFSALFVKTKEFQRMTQSDKDRLRANVYLAQQLGASIETIYGDDISIQIAEFARLSGVTKIVLGRSGFSHRAFFRKPTLTERLIDLVPGMDIYIIPDGTMGRGWNSVRRDLANLRMPAFVDLLKTVLLLAMATLIGVIFYRIGFTESNIITVYLMSVMLTALATKSPICCLVASISSVLTFSFFFTEPRFSLLAYDSGYPVTFLIMFAAALFTGSMAGKLKSHAERSAEVAWHTKVLFETNQNLQKAMDQSQIIAVTAGQLVKLLQRDVVAYRVADGTLTSPSLFYAGDESSGGAYTTQKERQVAQWVLKHNRRAGATTETFADSHCLYLSIRISQKVYGVVGIAADEKPLDAFENSILLSILGECALALENRKNAEEKEAAAVLAKNEQLRANLLRSISHDLRTPLTSISGNASNLISNGELFDEQMKQQMYTDIYDDSMWLINLVENLLSVSRLEEGRMNLHLSTELMDEVVSEALRHVNRKSAEYHLSVDSEQEYILAQIDAKLIVQVLINLVDNAIKYTPPGSQIAIHLQQQGKMVQVCVADDGLGIPDEAKPHIFDMFYSAANKVADSRRSMGLGLALCKSIVNAHGGEITVADNVPHGTIFTFSLPAGEVELHE